MATSTNGVFAGLTLGVTYSVFVKNGSNTSAAAAVTIQAPTVVTTYGPSTVTPAADGIIPLSVLQQYKRFDPATGQTTTVDVTQNLVDALRN